MLTIVTWLARAMALLGGIVLTGVVLMTTVSIIGRSIDGFANGDFLEENFPVFAEWLAGIGLGPVPGDFELVQVFVAFAIFAFLPICQLTGGHATVDIFERAMPKALNRYLLAFWEVLMALVILLIAWRLGLGFLEKLDNGQTTFFLQFPVWWSYGASLFAAVIASLVGLYCGVGRVIETATGRQMLPAKDGAVQ